MLAAQMVAAGRKPYLDFFVQQVPLYPLICGAGGFAAVVLAKENNDARIQAIRGGGRYQQSTETKDYVVFWKPKVQGVR